MVPAMRLTAQITRAGRLRATADGYTGQPPDRVAATLAELIVDVLNGHNSQQPTTRRVEAEVTHIGDAIEPPAARPVAPPEPPDVPEPPEPPEPPSRAAAVSAATAPQAEQRAELFRLIDQVGRTLAQAAAAVGVSRGKARRWYVNGQPAREDDTT